MTDLQLTIYLPPPEGGVGGTVYTYTDVDMGEGAVERAEAERDGVLERADVSVTVDVATFCGWASPVEVPAGRFRAELRDTARDEVVLNGVLERAGIRADEPGSGGEDEAGVGLRRWAARLFDRAADDVLEALDAFPLHDPRVVSVVDACDGAGGAPVGSVDVAAVVRKSDGSDEVEAVRFWHATCLLTAVLKAAGVAAPVVPALFAGTYRSLDSSAAEQALALPDRGYIAYVGERAEGAPSGPTGSLPDVSGAEFWELLRDHLGLTLDARYAAWPSADVEATVRASSFADVSADLPPEEGGLDGLAPHALAGWDLETDPAEVPDLAVRYANELNEPLLGAETTPDPQAVYASGRALYNASGVPPEGDHVALLQPRFVEVTTSTGDPDFDVTYGRPYLDGTAAEPYLVWLQGAALAVGLYAYQLASVPDGEPAWVNPTWAQMVYGARALEGSDLVRCQVEVDLDALAGAGVAAPVVGAVQYALEGAAWLTEAVESDPDSAEAALTLVRPAAGYAATAAARLVGPPQLYARILGRYQNDDPQQGVVSYYAEAVASPGAGLSAPDSYEVEVDVDGAGFTAVALVAGGSFTTDGFRATATVEPVNPASTHTFRARAVYAAEALTSDWVSEVAV